MPERDKDDGRARVVSVRRVDGMVEVMLERTFSGALTVTPESLADMRDDPAHSGERCPLTGVPLDAYKAMFDEYVAALLRVEMDE